MKFRDLFGIFKPERELAERGIFKGVQYRIDGDSVMLVCSSGKEVQFGPSPDSGINFDEQKRAVMAEKGRALSLKAYRPSTFPYDVKGKNTRNSSHPSRLLWNISYTELSVLRQIAGEIMGIHYRSQTRKRK